MCISSDALIVTHIKEGKPSEMDYKFLGGKKGVVGRLKFLLAPSWRVGNSALRTKRSFGEM